MIEVQIPAGKKAYFASDFHLGFPNNAESLAREKYIIAWLSDMQACRKSDAVAVKS